LLCVCAHVVHCLFVCRIILEILSEVQDPLDTFDKEALISAIKNEQDLVEIRRMIHSLKRDRNTAIDEERTAIEAVSVVCVRVPNRLFFYDTKTSGLNPNFFPSPNHGMDD